MIFKLVIALLLSMNTFAFSETCPKMRRNILSNMDFGTLEIPKADVIHLKKDSKKYSKELRELHKLLKDGRRKYILSYYKMKTPQTKDQFGGVNPNFFNGNIFIKKILEDIVDLKIGKDPKKNEKIKQLRNQLLLMDTSYNKYGKKPKLKIEELKAYFEDTEIFKAIKKRISILNSGFEAGLGLEYLFRKKKSYNKITRFEVLDKRSDFILNNEDLIAVSNRAVKRSGDEKISTEDLLIVDECKISDIVVIDYSDNLNNYYQKYSYLNYLLCLNLDKFKS